MLSDYVVLKTIKKVKTSKIKTNLSAQNQLNRFSVYFIILSISYKGAILKNNTSNNI